MSPDHFIGTQNARCVIVDDDTVRATIAGLWLLETGVRYSLDVLDEAALEKSPTETGPERSRMLGLDRDSSEPITPTALAALIRQARPRDHRRRRLDSLRAVARAWSPVVPGPRPLASVGVSDRRPSCSRARTVSWRGWPPATWRNWAARMTWLLDGGTAAWCEAGLPAESGPSHLLSPRDDLGLASSERPGDERANVTAYLEWEASLLTAIELRRLRAVPQCPGGRGLEDDPSTMKRRHRGHPGHWGWLIPVTHKHGIRSGRMVYVGGQVDKDINGLVLHHDDLEDANPRRGESHPHRAREISILASPTSSSSWPSM